MSDDFLCSSETPDARRRYIEMLRAMTPEQRLLKAFELTRTARTLLMEGLRATRPELSESERVRIWRRQIDRCRNQRY